MTSLQETLPILESAPSPRFPPRSRGVARGGRLPEGGARAARGPGREGRAGPRPAGPRAHRAGVRARRRGRDEPAAGPRHWTRRRAPSTTRSRRCPTARASCALRAAVGGESIDDLKTQVQEMGSRTEAAQQEAGQALDQLGQDMQTQRGELDSAVEAGRGRGAIGGRGPHQGRTTLEEATTELGDKMEALLGDVRAASRKPRTGWATCATRTKAASGRGGRGRGHRARTRWSPACARACRPR